MTRWVVVSLTCAIAALGAASCTVLLGDFPGEPHHDGAAGMPTDGGVAFDQGDQGVVVGPGMDYGLAADQGTYERADGGGYWVQSASELVHTPPNSLTASLTGVTAGDLIVATYLPNNTAQDYSNLVVTDSQGNLYARALQVSVATNSAILVFYAVAHGSGALSVVAPFPAGLAIDVVVSEYRGVTTLDAISDTSNPPESADALSPLYSGAVTTVQDGELLLVVGYSDLVVTCSPDYVSRYATSFACVEDRLAGPAGGYEAKLTTQCPAGTATAECFRDVWVAGAGIVAFR